jgi:hypothetical protein
VSGTVSATRRMRAVPTLRCVLLRETAKTRPGLVAGWLDPRVHRASGVTVREAVKPLPPDLRAKLLSGYREKRPVPL